MTEDLFLLLFSVEPAAVEEIKTIVNKTEISLSWTHSKPYMSLRFKIEYKSQWENSWMVRFSYFFFI